MDVAEQPGPADAPSGTAGAGVSDRGASLDARGIDRATFAAQGLDDDAFDADARAEDALERFLPHDEPSVERTHHVTALVVAHDGAEWLPRTLAALRAQSRPVQAAVGVDSGSLDDSERLLTESLDAVVTIGRREGLAHALDVAQAAAVALASSGRVAVPEPDDVCWYWIVHDDSAPDPDCLAELLSAADRVPQAVALVPKSVGWTDPTLLVGIGHMWAPGTPVVQRLEAQERDQGQYDFDRPVYAATSGGMLVQVDAWRMLGGFDRYAGIWAGPADFCRRVWGAGGQVHFVPRAVIAHREAGHRGVRRSAYGRRLPRRAARSGQLYLELTQAPGWALPGRYLRAWISTLARVLALLVTREPEESMAELAGAWDVLGHPMRVLVGRRRARRPPVVDLVRPPHLRAYRGTVLKRAFEGWMATTRVRWRAPREWRLPPHVWKPLAVAGVLAFLAVLREPRLLFGAGDLQGGGLLPAAGSRALLSAYASSWQDAWLGTPATPPAYLALLSAAGALALGSVDALLRACFTLAVPLAFLGAYASLGPRVVPGQRMALALAWACMPAGVAAAGAGRISTLAVLLLGPLVLRSLARWWTAVQPASTGGGDAGVRPAIAAGTMLGIVSAFAPLVLLLAAATGLVGWARLRFPRWLLPQGLVVLGSASAFVVLWVPRVVQAPWLLLSDLGRNDPLLADPGAWVWGLSPGGPASVAWAGLPLVVAVGIAVVAGRPGPSGFLALAGTALLMIGVAWSGPAVAALWPQADPRTLWPGLPMLVAGGLLALLMARLAAREGQVQVGLRAAWLVCVGVLVLGWWSAPSGPTTVTAASALPPVVSLDADGPGRPRAVVVARASGDLVYGISTGPGARLGDADAIAGTAPDPRVADVVQGLVSGAGGDVEAELGGRGIRYVVFDGSPSDPVVAELDAAIGLRRLASSADQSLWLVTGDPVRARLTETPGAGPVDVPILTRPTSIDVVIHPQTPLPRGLVVAEQADPGWSATLDGQAVQLVEDGRGMLTAVADAPGRLTVRHSDAGRWLAPLQLAVMAALAVLALPKRRDGQDVT